MSEMILESLGIWTREDLTARAGRAGRHGTGGRYHARKAVRHEWLMQRASRW
jgi:hypothetical protein